MTIEQLELQARGLFATINRQNKVLLDMGECLKKELDNPCHFCAYDLIAVNQKPCCECEQYDKWEWYK